MIIEFLLNATAVLLLAPVLVFFTQVLSACFPKTNKNGLKPTAANVAILVPAHNEAEGIAATINSIMPQLKPGDRLLVVADNCTDNTAAVATANGAEALERHDPGKPGKGYALDFGINFLAQNPPDIVVIIDADCIVAEHTLNKLATYASHHMRPVQGLYLMFSPRGTGLKTRIAEFAWVVKGLVRPRGYAKLGLPCQLMGSGMAFPWEILSRVNLANGNIVEDMKLGIDLCKVGKPPIFLEDAMVTSYFPNSASAQAGQRTRWEHGHLGMILAEAPRLFWLAGTRLNKDLFGMAFDLCVPPLALLVVMLSALLAIAAIASFSGVSTLPLMIAVCAMTILTLAILLAWWNWGRQIITLTTLLLVPVYVISKIPFYFSFIFKRQKKWIRTDRN